MDTCCFGLPEVAVGITQCFWRLGRWRRNELEFWRWFGNPSAVCHSLDISDQPVCLHGGWFIESHQGQKTARALRLFIGVAFITGATLADDPRQSGGTRDSRPGSPRHKIRPRLRAAPHREVRVE